jgi:hypothetical protein
MKRWIPALLLPVLLLQAPVFAQIESPLGVNEQPQSKTTPSAASPTLLPLKGTEQVRLQLVNCGWWLDCAVARLLLPASATINQRELQFDNSTQSSVDILNAAAILQGDFTGYQLTNSAISLPKEVRSLPANQIVRIPLTLDRSQMPPDQYTGAIYLTLQNRSDRLVLPIDLSVRSGPLMPLVVLFFGVILGRLFKYMQERGEPQARSLGEVYRLRTDIERAKLDDQNKQLLLAMVPEMETMVDREQLDNVPAEIQAIRNRLDILVKLQLLESQLNEKAKTLPTDADEFTTPIRKVRRLITEKKDGEAKSLLEEISTNFDNYDSTRGAGVESLAPYKRSIQEAVTATNQINQPGAIQMRSAHPTTKIQRFLITLSGVSERVRAEATFWVVRPLLSLILLVGLAAIGMRSLYVENGTAFGARPFADYLGLILWGLSADVASRSLSSLQGGKEQ